LRSGGYVIDFWGLGYDIAERMGLTDSIERVGYPAGTRRRFTTMKLSCVVILVQNRRKPNGSPPPLLREPRWGLFMRDQVIKTSAVPRLARLAFGRDTIDKLPLPDYRCRDRSERIAARVLSLREHHRGYASMSWDFDDLFPTHELVTIFGLLVCECAAFPTMFR
jgi:hypothetical protein